MTELNRVPVVGRAVCLAAVFGLALLTGDPVALQSAIVLTVVSALAISASVASPLPEAVIATVEALVAALVIGLVLPHAITLLPYLVMLSALAAASGGLRALVVAFAAQVVPILGLPWLYQQNGGLQERSEILAPWLLTSLGAGVLGAWVRQMGDSHSDESYASAHRLLSQLRTVARRLSAGLDPIEMSAHILARVHDRLGDTNSAVFVRTDGGSLTPLGYRVDVGCDLLDPRHQVVEGCWAEMEPRHVAVATGDSSRRHLTALPLRSGSQMIGVVLSQAGAPPDPRTLEPLMRELDEYSFRLDTALAFDEIRSLATVEERRRLSREIHDGVAQDIASLGYLVDNMTAMATTPEQEAALSELRSELTRVVTELRLSIFDLRSEVVQGSGLGSALSEYIHQVGARSNMTVHLTLDEDPHRLRREVETELLRIAQEAITNARKHSGAQNLWVHCRVSPPFARLEIRDDGGGLGQSRADSYGLRIMRERAERIGARLDLMNGDPQGTVVLAVVGHDADNPLNIVEGG